MKRWNSAQSLFTVTLLSLACLAFLVIATGYVLMRQNAATERLNKAIDLHDKSYRLADQLRQSSDDLTRMVRTYAVTGDGRFEEYFYTILKIRDGKAPRPEHYDRIFWDFKVAGEATPGSQDGKRVALRSLMEGAGFSDQEFALLAEAKRRSDALVELEETALHAMKGRIRDVDGAFTIRKSPDRDLALQILFGNEYHQAKSEIMKPINAFLVATDERNAKVLADAQQESRSLSLALVCLFCGTLIVAPLVIVAGYRYHRISHTKLRDSEARLQALLNAPLESIFLIGRDGTILSINESGARRFRSTPDALSGRNVYEVLPADVAQRRKVYIDQVFRTGEAIQFEDQREGTLFANSVYPVLPPQGAEVTGVAVFAEDITARKQAEDEQRKNEQLFRGLMEQSPLAIEVLTPDGRIREVNDAWMRLWGFNKEEANQALAAYNMLTDKQTADLGVAATIQKAFSGEPVVLPPMEYVVNKTLDDIGLEHIRGQSPWIQCHLYPVKNSSGEITNVVNTYMDITEQKQAERDLKAYQKRLRALALELTMAEERERRRIATELHDGAAQSLAFARMQLASIAKEIVEAEIAKKIADVSQVLRESLRQIREVLLDLSSPSMNEIGLGVAISEWLEQQIGRRHGLKTSFTDECGKVPLDDDVRAVLFRNSRELLTNVVKHAQADSVAVRMESTGEALRITIEDDGVGLDSDDAADTTGGGFGIFSVRERMLDLGGSLEIVSAYRKGCTATLVMPFDRGQETNQS